MASRMKSEGPSPERSSPVTTGYSSYERHRTWPLDPVAEVKPWGEPQGETAREGTRLPSLEFLLSPKCGVRVVVPVADSSVSGTLVKGLCLGLFAPGVEAN